MARRALLIHGWRVKDPHMSIGRLAPHLASLGYEPLVLRYGFTLTASQTRFRSNKAAKNWSARTLPDDVVIGHSNGSRVAFEMSHTGECLARTMVWIQPALDADLVPGRSVERLLVLYNPFDRAVRMGSWMPDSIWGPMGSEGYSGKDDPFGPDPRITSRAYGHGHSPWAMAGDLALTIHEWVKKGSAP